MNLSDLKNIAVQLAQNGVTLEKGLSDAEISDIEREGCFQFPPDLRAFLRQALPIQYDFPDYRGSVLTDYFPNWRLNPREIMRIAQHRLLDGIMFDVEFNHFWLPSWGKRPLQISEALAEAQERFSKAPLLIPVFEHRYISSAPLLSGNPVFSISQTDIVRYGNDLFEYLCMEFNIEHQTWSAGEPRRIDFWDDIIDHQRRIR